MSTVRRHGKHCFCSACLQDEMNAKDDRIEALEAELAKWRELFSAMREALNEDDRPYKGWHRLRYFLESRGQFVDDLSDYPLLIACIDTIMKEEQK